VTQAQAGLARLQVTPTEVGAAEAALAQQRAVTAKAANPYVASDLEAAQAQVLIAEAGVKTAALNLRDAAITAPFDGVVAAKNVSAGALASPGAVLLELVSTEVRGVFTIEEAQVSAVKVGQAAVLRSSAYPGEQFTGTVTVINPTANSATRSFGVRIKPEDPRGRLMSGMFAEATLVTTEKANVLAVPEASVVTRDGKSYVFVIIDNKAQRREVAPGLRAEGKVEVTSGVSAGEQVVVVGQNLLNDGDTVTVRQP
jgi:RND family efflux transporter MFP subunit